MKTDPANASPQQSVEYGRLLTNDEILERDAYAEGFNRGMALSEDVLNLLIDLDEHLAAAAYRVEGEAPEWRAKAHDLRGRIRQVVADHSDIDLSDERDKS